MEWDILLMSIKDYLKDKLYFIIVFVATFTFINLFLIFINVSKSIIIMIDIGYLIIFTSVMCVEFYRRYTYYNEIITTLNELEEKYLIFDLIKNKNFIDSKILQEVVRLGNYSMNNKVELYRNNEEDYRRYIELWVHEIKTPLSALNLMVENNNTENAKEELDRIAYYIEQSLYYARSSSVYKDYLIEEINLRESITKTIKHLKNSFIKKDININLDLKANNVFSDSKWLEFIIKQVLINSIQYSNSDSKVKIQSRNIDNAIVLEIIDEGIGISESDIPRIFDLGFTGESGRVYNQATGMGLYLVKKLCESLHINVEIISDMGVKVTLIIPKSTSHFQF